MASSLWPLSICNFLAIDEDSYLKCIYLYRKSLQAKISSKLSNHIFVIFQPSPVPLTLRLSATFWLRAVTLPGNHQPTMAAHPSLGTTSNAARPHPTDGSRSTRSSCPTSRRWSMTSPRAMNMSSA